MRQIRMALGIVLMLGVLTGTLFAQSTGDFRSHQSGDWGTLSTWERFNGSTWDSPAPSLPDTLHATTVRSPDSISVTVTSRTYVGTSTIDAGAKVAVIGVADTTVGLSIANGTMTVNGVLMQTGPPSTASPYAVAVTSSGALIIGNGGTFQQDQSGGSIPTATWNDGSTLLVTGVTTSTNMGGSPGVSYYNIVWNCPNQTTNANMGMHPGTGSLDTTTTIRGDLTVLSTGTTSSARVYFCGPNAGTATDRQVSRINVLGNISVLNGSILSSNGTSKAYTDIIVTVMGNIHVRDSVFLTGASVTQFSQLSISRGSQGGGTGTATWYLKGDSIVYGRKTTNSNSSDPSTPTATNRGRFIFCKPGTQVIALDDSIAWTGPCNMQFGDSTAVTTIYAGNSPFIGSGCVQQIKHNATLILGENGYVGGGTNSNGGASTFSMDSGATLVTASENGIRATGMGSSGAVRVSGTRDYGTAANFEYNGSVDQRLGSGFPASANDLTINNPLGVYIDSVAAFTVDNALAVNDGYLDLNGATVTLGPSAHLAETPLHTVRGTSGVITTTRSLNAPSLSTNIAGMGVGIGSGADLGSTVITRGHAQQGGNSILRYFIITPTNNSGLAASLNFFYDNSEIDGQIPSALQLWESVNNGTSWNVLTNTVDTSLHVLGVTGLGSLWRYTAGDADHPSKEAYTYGLKDGWNMISLPMVVGDPRQVYLFPNATSRAFAYEGGYIPKDSLTPGLGYWLKVSGAQSPAIFGVLVDIDSITVATGWNMIGSIGVPVAAVNVQTDPPGLTASPFFGYDGAYIIADSIRPGIGYWIRVTAPGKLVLSGSSNPLNRIHIVPTDELPPPPPEVAGEEHVRGIPTVYRMSQNYPNPFNPSTSVEIAVPRTSYVNIAVYNVLGERIATVFDGQQSAGYHTIVWNGLTGHFVPASSGIYFLRMAAEGFTATQKILLTK